MSEVYTEQEGKTYTILQLVNKIRKEMKEFGTLTVQAGEHYDEEGLPSVEIKHEDGRCIFVFDYMKGPKGDTGARGPIGPQGPQGEPGDNNIVLSPIYSLGTLTTNGFRATFTDYIPTSGLAIIMFNTTCVIVPYAMGIPGNYQPCRFVCSAIYNLSGVSRVVRSVLKVTNLRPTISETEITVEFDNDFINLLEIAPTGIIRFISFNEEV